jgi:hypothetical protein
MDAKSANKKKEDNRISHKWCGDRKPGHSFGEGGIFLRITGNPPPTNPQIYSYMVEQYPQAGYSAKKVDHRYPFRIFQPL